ncbi:hypothetical protein GCM10027275_33240 [Rhabdobacter roseus]|uniref:Glycosyltransferase involved in cell wall biosynthesis n=1 Tax=Rhabdobacter roseus TaxID=1655419 RepID=A0A840TQ42_9BACT|nr:glycosyltransferase family 4 protein [Rhabdobacter roseus]MBB5285454.1 glycosyltransferase involved in cell wall biosynthesis [Rhabdobacter roseus]
MKIAILAPIAWRTPPRQYGPWEQVASNVAEGLVARGLEVTLFATADSLTQGTLKYSSPCGYAEDSSLDPKVEECLHISHLMEQASQFDLIHNHFDFLPLTYSRLIRTPMITTIHGFSSPRIVPVYKKYNESTSYVSISNSDRHPELRYLTTVYNGINPAEFTFQAQPQDYLLFFGRIHPEKGTYEAIQIAKAAKRPLIISGLVQDQRYFEEKVQPYLDDDQVLYVGNAGPAQRDKLLRNAYALLHPISFEEPFGLSVAEAMFCGTPVIAFRRGSMPELIQHEKTGFLVETTHEAAEAVERIATLDRQACRTWASSQFSVDKMVDGYLKAYEAVLDQVPG